MGLITEGVFPADFDPTWHGPITLKNAARFDTMARIMHNAITITTLSAIVITTVYSQSDDDFQDSTGGVVINFVSMVLPLLTAALVAIMSNAAP